MLLVEWQSRHCSCLLLPLGLPSSIYQIEGTMQVSKAYFKPICISSTFCMQNWSVYCFFFYLLYAKRLHSICISCRNLKKAGEITSSLSPVGTQNPKTKKPLNICYPYLVDLPREAIRGCSIRSSSLQSLSLSCPALSQTPLSSSCSLSVAPIEHQSTQALRSHGAGISPLCKQRRTPPRL